MHLLRAYRFHRPKFASQGVCGKYTKPGFHDHYESGELSQVRGKMRKVPRVAAWRAVSFDTSQPTGALYSYCNYERSETGRDPAVRTHESVSRRCPSL